MKKLVIGILLALIPVVYFILIYSSLSEERRLCLFRRNLTCYYTDWIFVIFNFIWVFVVAFNFDLFFILFVVSLIGNILVHSYFIKVDKKERRKCFFLNKKQGDFSFSGSVHLTFSTIETSLVLMFLFSSISSSLFYMDIIILGIYFLALIPASIKVHKKIITSDLLFSISGIFVLLLKTFI